MYKMLYFGRLFINYYMKCEPKYSLNASSMYIESIH